MSLQHLAHHIAAKGRHGDDTLVHVSKDELAGLQALAKKHGTSLTVNPQTGLPEAFGLRNLVPMAMGAASTYFTGNPYLGMAIAGGTTYAQTGSLQQGVLAGLGAWGGGQLAAGVAGMGAAATQAGTQVAAGEAAALGEEAARTAVETEAARQAAQKEAAAALMEQGGSQTAAESARLLNASAAPQVSQSALEQSAREYASNAAGNTYELTGGYRPTFGAEAMGPQLPGTASSAVYAPAANGLSQAAQAGLTSNTMAAGANAAMSNPGGYIDALGGGWKAAGYGAAALAPAIAESMERKPYAQPNIQGDSDMGPRYLFNSGYSNDIPGRTGPASYQRMTPEEAKKYYGFAEGGEVQYPYGESVVRMNDGGSVDKRQSGAVQGVLSGPVGAAQAMAQRISGVFGGQQMPDMMHQNAGEDAGQQYSYDPESEQYVKKMASGGITHLASGGLPTYMDYQAKDVLSREQAARDARNSSYRPSQDYSNYYQQTQQPIYSQYSNYVTPGYETTGYSYSPYGYGYGYDYSGYDAPVSTGITGIPTKTFQYDPAVLQAIMDAHGGGRGANSVSYSPSSGYEYDGGSAGPGPGAAVSASTDGINNSSENAVTDTTDTSAVAVAATDSAPAASVSGGEGGGDGGGDGGSASAAHGGYLHHNRFQRMAAGGIADLGSYSDGGRLLKGPGDGMSDNIPAQIGQKQPARLADGEFVVPADVVSHLGNGSTDAGAKQLYKMMDNIRKARTGRKAQGKQINPRKYLPA